MSAFESFKSLSRAMYLGFRRDRTALFFTVLFPLTFLVIFGAIFSDQSTSKVEVVQVGKVPVLEQALAQGGEELREVLTVTRTSDREEALRQVAEGDVAGAVEQDGRRVVVHYSAADQVRAGTVRGLMNSVIQAANQAATGRPPAYTLDDRQVEDDSLKAIQFFTPGLLGWALASAAVFAASQTLVTWRTKGILRRLQLSPAPIPIVFAARVAVSVGVALVQFALFVLVARLPVFGLRLEGAWWMAVPLLVAGVLAFLSIGMLVGAWARTQEAANAVTQLIVLPMAFLGGSFFPLDQAPGWMQTVSYVFPLRYLNEGMLNVMSRGLGAESVLTEIGILLGVAVVGALIAARLFRWEAH